MKTGYFFFAFLLSFFFSQITYSQVSNLQINGVSSNFTMASGGAIYWSYNVPTGTTANDEIWYDVNQNGIIDAGDILYAQFPQTDGIANGNNGPGDGDGLANGTITLSSTVLGLAPGMYILKFSQNNSSAIVSGTVTPLLNPSHSLSGKVTTPAGISAANFIVEVSRSNQYSPNFWDGVTDANGNYTIQMNSDTAGNPWQVYITANPYASYIVVPNQIMVTITGNPADLNFTLSSPAAQVGGLIKDDNGNILSNLNVDLMKINNNNNTNMQVEATTNGNGIFHFGLSSQSIDLSEHWRVWAASNNNSGVTTDMMAAVWNFNVLNIGDSLFANLTAYRTNTQISGVVKYNGNNVTTPVQLIASDLGDIAESSCWSENNTGNFTIQVTNKFSSYKIGGGNSVSGGYVYASPGDAGVILNLGFNGVKWEDNGMPTVYSLSQNYPNPFNPSTTITFGIPERSNVILTIYNQLGQKVDVLANEIMSPGMHSVNWNAMNLSSGIYFYELKAGSFQSVKKLILMK